jgi:hypothetical protein
MGFRTGSYAKIWGVESKGNYSVVDMSISKKNKQSGEYETDFSSKFVRFIGTANKDAANLQKNDTIKIGECEVTSVYDKEKKTTYTNFLVFSFEKQDSNGTKTTSKPKEEGFMNIPSDIDADELPFA